MNSPLDMLSETDLQTVRECLTASETNVFFPEWEFETLFGISRSQLSSVREKWPNVDVGDPDVGAAIVGALSHMIGYPHTQGELWRNYISVGPDDVRSTMERVLALGI